MRITNNTYALSGGYFSAVNDIAALGDVYGIHTQSGVILIDCGAPVTGAAMLRETLAYFNVTEPITHVVITHAHWDHCGSAKELQDAGAKITVGAGDVFYCENGGVKGTPSPFEDEQAFPAFTPDTVIEDGQTKMINGLSFEFIGIPGHTPGSMAIKVSVDGKTQIYTGDALQPDGCSLEHVTFGWQGDPNFDRRAIVASMLKLAKFETDMVLPGHGKVCLRNGTRVLINAARTAYTAFR